MILSAQTIRKRGLITPFCERSVAHGMTYGLSSCGYDVRIAETITLTPAAFEIASTVERFKIPNDLAAKVLDKSTWARRGLTVQNTIAEPGWEGWLTLELTNHSYRTIRLLAGMPIAQIVFEMLDEPTEQPYEGRYQNQEKGPQRARLIPAEGKP